MDSFHIVTFYEITYIDNFKRLGREIERIGTKEKLSGTFFSTPQGVNATLSGSLLGFRKSNSSIEFLRSKYRTNMV